MPKRFSFVREDNSQLGRYMRHPTGEFVFFNDYDFREGELLAEIEQWHEKYLRVLGERDQARQDCLNLKLYGNISGPSGVLEVAAEARSKGPEESYK